VRRISFCAVVSLGLATCGTSSQQDAGPTDSLCKQIDDQLTRILNGRTTCAYTANGTTHTIDHSGSLQQCEDNFINCTKDDVGKIQALASCLKQVPTCVAGNEQISVDPYFQCVSYVYDATTNLFLVTQSCVPAID